jgi:glucose-1-phosphate cytidylyltransferase
MKLVILAGGLGTRISEQSEHRPKPLVPIGEKPIIWHLMKIYSAHGINDFIICTGYKSEMIKEYFSNYTIHNSDFVINTQTGKIDYLNQDHNDWNITIVDTGLSTMTGGRLRRVRHLLDPNETFCLTYGDGVSDIDVSAEIKFHREQGRKATIAAVVPPARFGALKIQGTHVESFVEKPDGGEGLINGGFFVLEPSVLDLLSDDDDIWERRPLETLAATQQLSAYIHRGFWRPMDTLRDKRELDILWASDTPPWKVW